MAIAQFLPSSRSDQYFLAALLAIVAGFVYKTILSRSSRAKVESANSVPSSPTEQKSERPSGAWVPQQYDYPTITPSSDPLSLKPIPYRPFRWGAFHVVMDLRSMPSDEWIEIDSQFTHFAKIRETRMDARGDRVIRTLPASAGVGSGAPAAVELLYELAEYLHRRYPSMYSVTRHSAEKSTYGWYGEGDIKTITVAPLNRTFTLGEGDPLRIVTMLIQEDLAIMIEGEDGRYYFQAGTVCNAGTWRLEDKIGMPLEDIHTSGGVPRYKSNLEVSMTRYFRRMNIDKPTTRNNYSFQVVRPSTNPFPDLDPSELGWAASMKGDEDLIEHEGRRWLTDTDSSLPEISNDNAELTEVEPSMIWLRSERETLRRLPRTGAIIFTIRVYQTPLVELVKEPGVPGRIASAIRSWPEDVAIYRAKNAFEGILDYLDECHAKQVAEGLNVEEVSKPFPY